MRQHELSFWDQDSCMIFARIKYVFTLVAAVALLPLFRFILDDLHAPYSPYKNARFSIYPISRATSIAHVRNRSGSAAVGGS